MMFNSFKISYKNSLERSIHVSLSFYGFLTNVFVYYWHPELYYSYFNKKNIYNYFQSIILGII